MYTTVLCTYFQNCTEGIIYESLTSTITNSKNHDVHLFFFLILCMGAFLCQPETTCLGDLRAGSEERKHFSTVAAERKREMSVSEILSMI